MNTISGADWSSIFFFSIRISNFRVEDVFIGYNSDTVAAVVLQASSKSLMHGSTMESPTNDQIAEVCYVITVNSITRISKIVMIIIFRFIIIRSSHTSLYAI